MINWILPVILLTLMASCQMKGHLVTPVQDEKDASYQWLEEVEGAKALEFAKAENQQTLEHFQKNPLYAEIQKDFRKIIFNKDKLTAISLKGGMVHNFWQDEKNPKGLYRRTTLKSYQSATPQWEILLDLDALSKKENENWVWKGAEDLTSNPNRSILYLSRGGKDATVKREYDWQKKQFINPGFNLPEAKGGLDWIDENQVLFSTDFGPGSLSSSGYPRQVRLWKRGEDFKKSKLLYESEENDMRAFSIVYEEKKQRHLFIVRQIDFYNTETFYVDKDLKLVKVPVPNFVQLETYYKGFLIFKSREEYLGNKPGTLISLPLTSLLQQTTEPLKELSVIFRPTEKTFVQWASANEHGFYLSLVDDIIDKINQVEPDGKKGWIVKKVAEELPGNVSMTSFDRSSPQGILVTTDFLTPPTQYLLSPNGQIKKLKAAPASFRSEDMKFTRHQARSFDGTMIPYFLVSKKDLKLDGQNPTVLYGYGGFQVSLSPGYRGTMGKAWLERGGVFVVANLRGGGEFGPHWHESVLKENRYKVYEDFVAIAEDLISRKVTSPQRLGIWGGSNGGLLTGATMVLRPELFQAVISEVPLLDMFRYHKLLAGASWMAEYGDPEDPKMREAILRYSPFQNVKVSVSYPEAFFMTSTKDDRVHPGHARKMVAKMKEQGHKVHYYENMDGGHGRTSNPESEVVWGSLQWTYFWEKLGGK